MITVMLRLESLGYEYRGCDYPLGGVCVMYGNPNSPADTLLLLGESIGDILARMDELPIVTTDPLLRRIEERRRAKK